jgi:hypothetical protein
MMICAGMELEQRELIVGLPTIGGIETPTIQ